MDHIQSTTTAKAVEISFLIDKLARRLTMAATLTGLCREYFDLEDTIKAIEGCEDPVMNACTGAQGVIHDCICALVEKSTSLEELREAALVANFMSAEGSYITDLPDRIEAARLRIHADAVEREAA